VRYTKSSNFDGLIDFYKITYKRTDAIEASNSCLKLNEEGMLFYPQLFSDV